MLEQAAAMKISPDDEDLVEYITVLREGILEAYIGVVQGLHDGGGSPFIKPHLGNIFQFLEVVVNENGDDPSLIKNSVGLIGDLATLLVQHAEEVSVYFRQNFVVEVIQEALRQDNLRDIALWTQTKRDTLLS
jgi:importin subunit beta-1